MQNNEMIASHLPAVKAMRLAIPECPTCRKPIDWQRTPKGKWISIDRRTGMPHTYACKVGPLGKK